MAEEEKAAMKDAEIVPIKPVEPTPAPESEDEDEDEEATPEDFELIAEEVGKLCDRLAQRQTETGGETFMRKMQTSFSVTTRAELRDWVYALLLELAKCAGALAEGVGEIAEKLNEVSELAVKQGYILQAFASNSILGVGVRLAELVLARVQDDKELRELAQSILTSVGAANADK